MAATKTKKRSTVKKQTTKKVVKQPKIVAKNAKTRKKPAYKHFRLGKRIKHLGPPLPNWWQLTNKSLWLMRANWRQLLVYVLVMGFLTMLFVRGFSSVVDTTEIRETLDGIVDDADLGLTTGFTAFGLLLSSTADSADGVGQLYQSVLLVIGSLAVIWLYRQQQAGNTVTMKMAFYRGMYPLIPYLLLIVVAGLQLLPAILGNTLFTILQQSNLIVNGLEMILWASLLIMTFIASFYMLSNTLIALYVVTLPEMTPMLALKKSKEIVAHRRLAIMLRMLALILVMLFAVLVLVLPMIFIVPSVAEWWFFALSILAIPFLHGYMFSLYRELL